MACILAQEERGWKCQQNNWIEYFVLVVSEQLRQFYDCAGVKLL